MRSRLPCGVLLVEVGDGLLRRRVPRGREVAELGRALEQFPKRLADGGEVLVQVGRHLGQVVARGRLGGKAQADPNGIDLLAGLIDGRLIDLYRLPAHVEVFLADASAGRQFLAAFEVGLRQLQRGLLAVQGRHGSAEIGDLVIDLLDGMCELEAIGPGRGHLPAD